MNPAVANLPRSGIRAAAEAAASRPDVVPLHRGDPDWNAPAHVWEAAYEQARRGARYGPGPGTWELREALASKLTTVNGLTAKPDRMVVTHGAVQGCAAVLEALVEPGDEVLAPDPGWPNAALQAGLRGATIRNYRLRHDHVPDIEEVASLIGPRTRVLVINSPSNPAGSILPREHIECLVELAERHDFVLLSDEAYEEVYFVDDRPPSAASYDSQRVVSLFSFSKTYAMTGWRIGYLHAPDWLVPALARFQEVTLGGVSVVTQAGALAALTGPQDVVQAMRKEYRQRARLMGDEVAAADVVFTPPSGGYFALLPTAGRDSASAAAELLDRGVAVVPGSAFGPGGEGFVRVSLCAGADALRNGLGLYFSWFHSKGAWQARGDPRA